MYVQLNFMERTYTLKRRAEQQADTRRHIVDAALDLHISVGPVRATFSMAAEQWFSRRLRDMS